MSAQQLLPSMPGTPLRTRKRTHPDDSGAQNGGMLPVTSRGTSRISCRRQTPLDFTRPDVPFKVHSVDLFCQPASTPRRVSFTTGGPRGRSCSSHWCFGTTESSEYLHATLSQLWRSFRRCASRLLKTTAGTRATAPRFDQFDIEKQVRLSKGADELVYISWRHAHGANSREKSQR